MRVRLATTTNIAWQARFVWQCFDTFQKHFFACHKQKNVCQERVCVVAKPTNIVLDKQNFKYLPNYVCPFGRPGA